MVLLIPGDEGFGSTLTWGTEGKEWLSAREARTDAFGVVMETQDKQGIVAR